MNKQQLKQLIKECIQETVNEGKCPIHGNYNDKYIACPVCNPETLDAEMPPTDGLETAVKARIARHLAILDDKTLSSKQKLKKIYKDMGEYIPSGINI